MTRDMAQSSIASSRKAKIGIRQAGGTRFLSPGRMREKCLYGKNDKRWETGAKITL